MVVLSRSLAAIFLAVGAVQAALPVVGCNDIDAAPALRPGDFNFVSSCQVQGEQATPMIEAHAQGDGHDHDHWPDAGAPAAPPAVETSSPVVTTTSAPATGTGVTTIKGTGTGTGTFAVVKPTGDMDSGAGQVAPLYIVPVVGLVAAAMIDI